MFLVSLWSWASVCVEPLPSVHYIHPLCNGGHVCFHCFGWIWVFVFLKLWLNKGSLMEQHDRAFRGQLISMVIMTPPSQG